MYFRLPPEVISNQIFPFLRFNDLLRLRRVCKVSKNLAEDFLRVYGTLERVVRINVDERSCHLTNFLALTYPITLTKFDLVNEDSSSWNRKELQAFLGLYGDKITHLKIYRLTIPIKSPAAIQFFEGLPNLKELRIEHLCGKQVDDSPSPSDSESESDSDDEEDPQFEPPDRNLPSTFKRLKHLHVKKYSCSIQQVWKLLEECSAHLECINHPRPRDFQLSLVPGSAFERIRWIVERRHRQNPGAPNLEYVDLDDLECEDWRSFYELVTTCSAHSVKLQNVNARLIEEMMQLDTPDWELHGDKISRCVVSIKDLTRSVFRLKLPFLEKIDIESTAVCSMPERDFIRYPWGSLKELKLWMNSEYLAGHGERVATSRLIEFFFHGIRRENLETLDIAFLRTFYSIHLPYPEITVTGVWTSCPNLKKLNIYNWPVSNRDIAQLWGNLPLLEDVTFEDCKHLGDAAFIGEDVIQPTVWKATRLKSLTFKYLEEMPGITDNLFKSALRHMPLKSLFLDLIGSVSSITLTGLESLLTGKFAETVEKFPLKGEIQLEGVTNEQLAELEGKFRCKM